MLMHVHIRTCTLYSHVHSVLLYHAFSPSVPMHSVYTHVNFPTSYTQLSSHTIAEIRPFRLWLTPTHKIFWIIPCHLQGPCYNKQFTLYMYFRFLVSICKQSHSLNHSCKYLSMKYTSLHVLLSSCSLWPSFRS